MFELILKMEDIYEDNPGISRTELYRRALQQAQQNNQRPPTRNQVEAFYNRNQQQNTFSREYLRYKPMPIMDKNYAWQADIFFPFRRSDDNKILILREIVSRYTIGALVRKKNLGKKVVNQNTGEFGQIELDEDDIENIVPIFENLINRHRDKINVIIADTEFNSDDLARLYNRKNIKYRFIISLLAHQFKNHNALGMIDNAIKNFRKVMREYMDENNITETQFMARNVHLQNVLNIMNNTVNTGIEIPDSTPNEIFNNRELYTQVKNLRKNKQDRIKDEWNELDDIDLSKPYLVADIKKIRGRNRYLPNPYFLHKLKDNKYVTKVNNVNYRPYNGDIEALRGYIVDENNLPLRIFKPYELKEYEGDYDRQTLLNQEPLTFKYRRGRPLRGGQGKYLTIGWLRDNHPELLNQYQNLRDPKPSLKVWLRRSGNQNIIDEFLNQN